MSDYIGTREQVDEYIGSRLVEAAYLGSRKYFDAYSEITGTLPLTYESRMEHILKNYVLYGSASGAGVETENLFDKDAKDPDNGFADSSYLLNTGAIMADQRFLVSEYIAASGQTTYYLYSFVNEGINTAVCFYDENKTFISGETILNKTSVVSPDGTHFLRITAQKARVDTATLTTTARSTSYIPHGFSIPMTVTSEETANLFDYGTATVGYYINAEGQEVASSTGNTCHSDYIPVIPNQAYTEHYEKPATGVVTVAVSWWDAQKTFISRDAVNLPAPAGAYNYTQTAPNNARFAIVNFVIYPTQSFADKTMFVLGTTPPSSYIPHRYSSTYPLYIGSSKLGAEEYVDYESGNVYKRTEQLIPQFVPQKKESEHLSIECSLDEITITVLAGASADETLYLDVAPFDIPISIGAGGTGVLVAFVQTLGNTGTYLTLRNRATNLIDYGYLISSVNLVKDSYTFRTQTQTCNRIQFQLSASATPTPQTFSIKLCLTDDGQTPAQYIPYLNPTDPPVPLPEILTYQGENTLSSTETLGECSVTGRINSVTP